MYANRKFRTGVKDRITGAERELKARTDWLCIWKVKGR